MDKFAPPGAGAVVELVTAHPLAWIVSCDAGDHCATLLPLRPVVGADGSVERLVGHFARSNRHVGVLQRHPRAMMLFLGPHGYISPSWMSDRTQAPTWNYASAQFIADIRFIEDDGVLADHVKDLVGAMETGRPNPWDPREMGARYAMLAARVIGFEAVVTERRIKFKLGQDERNDVFHDIISALHAGGETDLVDWMKRSNPGRS